MTQNRAPRLLLPKGREAAITRRLFLGGVAGVGAAVALAACSKPGGSGTSGTGDLRVYSWAGYDADENLSGFGKPVKIDAYSSNEEMIAKLVAARGTSGYDIVIPTGVFIPQMAENGLLEKLDLSRLPNAANLDAAFRAQKWDPDNAHSVCKFWGTTGFVYDTTVIKRELTSWDDFIDAAKHEARGRTSLVDDPGEIAAILCFARGWDQSTTDPDKLNQIRTFLVDELAPCISAFDSAPGGSAIPQGTQVLMHSWNGDARRGILNSPNPSRWRWVLPTPQTNLWMDNWAIVKGAPNVDAAYEFIDYSMGVDEAARNTEFVGYGTGIKGSKEQLVAQNAKMLEMIFPTDEQKARMYTGVINDAQQVRMEIVNEMKARAGR
jgi:spermidine/putrescine transport system substrate-binding protein